MEEYSYGESDEQETSEDDDMFGYLAEKDEQQALAALDDKLQAGQKFSHKTPPLFDGTQSYFQWEEDLMDWDDMTTLNLELRGPTVRSKFTGGAHYLKRMLSDRQRIKSDD